jgi:hypothetical protein
MLDFLCILDVLHRGQGITELHRREILMGLLKQSYKASRNFLFKASHKYRFSFIGIKKYPFCDPPLKQRISQETSTEGRKEDGSRRGGGRGK